MQGHYREILQNVQLLDGGHRINQALLNNVFFPRNWSSLRGEEVGGFHVNVRSMEKLHKLFGLVQTFAGETSLRKCLLAFVAPLKKGRRVVRRLWGVLLAKLKKYSRNGQVA